MLIIIKLDMESFKPSENLVSAEKREEKIRAAEIVVKEMFDRNIEASSVVRRVQEKPYFDDLMNREK